MGQRIFLSLILCLFSVSAMAAQLVYEVRHRPVGDIEAAVQQLYADKVTTLRQDNVIIMEGASRHLKSIQLLINTLDVPRRRAIIEVFIGSHPPIEQGQHLTTQLKAQQHQRLMVTSGAPALLKRTLKMPIVISDFAGEYQLNANRNEQKNQTLVEIDNGLTAPATEGTQVVTEPSATGKLFEVVPSGSTSDAPFQVPEGTDEVTFNQQTVNSVATETDETSLAANYQSLARTYAYETLSQGILLIPTVLVDGVQLDFQSDWGRLNSPNPFDKTPKRTEQFQTDSTVFVPWDTWLQVAGPAQPDSPQHQWQTTSNDSPLNVFIQVQKAPGLQDSITPNGIRE